MLGVALGLLTSTAIFLFLFWRLPRVQSPFRRVIKGACSPACCFEVLKRVGALYIERTTENPIYGIFAVVVGLLVWINIVSRMLLICAAWTVTAPYDSDVEPSGTANAATAEKAGIPTEFADHDPDDPPTLQEDGAPSPLAAAVQGQTPPQDVARGPRLVRQRPTAAVSGCEELHDGRRDGRGPERRWDGHAGPAARPSGRSRRARRSRSVTAAQFTAGALGMVVTAVLLHVLRTVRDIVRR